MKWYLNATVYIEGKFQEHVAFATEAGKFHTITQEPIFCEDGLDLKGAYVVPGFIDQHIHGSVGCDFMDGDVHANLKIANYLPSLGVTSFVATTLTDELPVIQKALDGLNQAFFADQYSGAECLGVHLEGPFINPGKKGAHESKWILPPSVDGYEALAQVSKLPIKIVTLAPECDENLQLIQHLHMLEVVPSAGHTQAKYGQMVTAVQHGLKCVTHCYNAMSAISSRDGGVLGAALMLHELSVEIISDGVHVSPENIRLYDRLIDDNRKILISDAMRARGEKSGDVMLGTLKAHYDGEKVTLKDGTLAGSALKQMDALKHYMETTGNSFENVIQMFTENPAKLLKIETRKGKIQVGADADFLILDSEKALLMTVCRGASCYRRADEDDNC